MTDKELNTVLTFYNARFGKVEREYLKLIGEQIKAMGELLPSQISLIVELKRMGRNLNTIKQIIATACDLTVSELDDVFDLAGKSDYRVSAERLTGISQPNLRLTPMMRSMIEAQYAETAGAMANLSNTTVVSQAYQNAVDAAIIAAQSGMTDYVTATRKAITQAARNGLRVTYASGHTRRLDTAVRQNVLDGVRALNRNMVQQVGKQFGADGVQVSAHSLCATDHLPYQGRIYSNEKWQSINDSLDRPFGMWNCRHVWFPVILGAASPVYTEEQLQSFADISNEQIKIGNVTLSRYEWTQEQRKIETKIREEENVNYMAQVVGDEKLHEESSKKIKELRTYYNTMSKAAGLIVKNERTQRTIR